MTTEHRVPLASAIYARKSTDQSDVSEDARSVTRQIEHARIFATKQGWSVAAEHIFEERDGTSGAVFGESRPGLMRLLNTLTPSAPVGALVMMEESRIGRESIETGYVVKQIIDAGVRVFTYLDGKERTLDNAMDKVMMHLVNFASEMEREKASQRVHDAFVRKVMLGHSVGNTIYGYDNVNIVGPDGATRLHVVRRVNEREATVVRRIFQEYADGTGLITLARRLNAESVPSPRGHGWSTYTIRDMVHREIYTGHIVWNRTQRIVKKGTQTARRRVPDEWKRLDAPDLRIIPDDLWQAAQTARRTHHAGFPRRKDGTLLGRPQGRDQKSQWLLTGLADCALCGSRLIGRKGGHGRWRKFHYVCGYNYLRGDTQCPNTGTIRREILDQAILDGLLTVLDDRIIAASIDEALEAMKQGQATSLDRRTQITRELSLIEARSARMVNAIANGDVPARSLKVGMERDEAQREALIHELADLDASPAIATLTDKALLKEIAAQAKDIRALLGDNIAHARQMLRKLEVRVVVERFGDEGVTYTLTGTYMKLVGRARLGRCGWARPACPR